MDAIDVRGTLPDVLRSLLPLTSVQVRRCLFVPVTGGWTAYFDHGWRGTDPWTTMNHLAGALSTRAVCVTAVPDGPTPEQDPVYGRYPARIFSCYGPRKTQLGGNTERAVSAMNDGGPWSFDHAGEPLDFECLEAYERRRIRDRLTVEMVSCYLRCMGIDGFNENAYRTHEGAILIEKGGRIAPGTREYSFEEARAG